MSRRNASLLVFRCSEADSHGRPQRVDQRHSSVVASDSEGNRSSRPGPVGQPMKMRATKQPFTTCGKLTTTLNESSQNTGSA